MKLRGIIALALMLGCVPALAQVTPGTSPLSVPKGGSGNATLTLFGLLYGNGTSPAGITAAMTNGQLLVGQTGAAPLPKTTTGDVTIDQTGATAIGANKVTNAQIRQSGPLSLIGRAANSTGNVADVGATPGSGCVFEEQGSALVCLPVATAGVANNAVTFAKIQQVAALSLIGNPTGSLANSQGITLGATLAFSGSALQTGALSGDVTSPANSFATTIAANAVTNAKLAQMSANTVKGNATNGVANAADVAAPLARSSSLMNIDAFTGHGDSIYSILATDRTVGTNAAFTASRTWTLPAANALNAGQELVVADFQQTVTATNTLVISRAGADTVNGGTSVTISSAGSGYLLKSDGTSKWTAHVLCPASAGASTTTFLRGDCSWQTPAGGGNVSNSGSPAAGQAAVWVTSTSIKGVGPTTVSTALNAGTATGSGGFVSGTYTTAAGASWLEVRMCGGGGGGGYGGTGTPTAATAGGNTTFGSSFLTANGGGLGIGNNGATSAGGTATGGDVNWTGQGGSAGSGSGAFGGGFGGNSALFAGGGVAPGSGGNAGIAAVANSGGGGSGGTSSGSAGSGQGGAAGGCLMKMITSPNATYGYSVGAAGAAGSTSTGIPGGAGSVGIIHVIEHYTP